MKYLFGIDIGGTTIKIGFFDGNHKLLKKWEIVTDISNNGNNILKDIQQSIEGFLFENQIDFSDIYGYGIGVPGATVNNVVNRCDNLGWPNMDVEKEFKKYIKSGKIVVSNDANIAALGELKAGAAKKLQSCVMITLGTGVGCGVIVDGKIIEGSNGAAGEIGHMRIIFDEPVPCNCGKEGCLETVASATGIVRETRKYLAQNPSIKTILLNDDKLTCKNIFDAAKNNDEVGLSMVDLLCQRIALASSYVTTIVNPDAIIIGGGVSKAGDILLEGIEKYFKIYGYHAAKNTKFLLANLGNDAGIYGASYLIL